MLRIQDSRSLENIAKSRAFLFGRVRLTPSTRQTLVFPNRTFWTKINRLFTAQMLRALENPRVVLRARFRGPAGRVSHVRVMYSDDEGLYFGGNQWTLFLEENNIDGDNVIVDIWAYRNGEEPYICFEVTADCLPFQVENDQLPTVCYCCGMGFKVVV